MALTQEGISDDQRKHLIRMISDVADSDPVQNALDALNEKSAERVKGNPEFVTSIQSLVARQIAKFENVDEYAEQEIESISGYPSGYKLLDLSHQISLLCGLFPEIFVSSRTILVNTNSIRSAGLPRFAEGWFAIPNWKKNPEVFGSTYCEAVKRIISTIKSIRNYRSLADEMNDKYLRQSSRSEQFWNEIARTQGDANILIIPAQFGLRHRGRSTNRSRVIMEDMEYEFGLGVFAVGSMLLTHPDRIQDYDDLWIDCAGDEWFSDEEGNFSRSPCFEFDEENGMLSFDASNVYSVSAGYGAASGFLPKQF